MDLSSDSINGSRDTSHIDSAWRITRSHSEAESLPNDFSIAVSVSLRDKLANLTEVPSLKR
ncbi:unannotated protein [freshwater metagenome]|uniref:Unannotated protein n=1 Tax=freshwater metagenome TaxID=449393 RepID=A0A6J6BC22_9ZZZZ